MDGDAKKVFWTVGAQMIALAIGLLTVFLIVWAASKAWKKGQAESGYGLQSRDWLQTGESGYDLERRNWMGF